MAESYHKVTEWIMAATAWPDSTLHVHFGLAIFFGASLLFRWPLAGFRPLAAVAIVELINECMDAAFFGSWHWGETGTDILHTLLWPVLLSIGANITQLRTTQAQVAGPSAVATLH